MKDINTLRTKSLLARIKIDEEVSFLARHISQAEWDRITAECTTVTVDTETGKTTSSRDEKAVRSQVGRFVVQDIQGLVDSANPDANGEPGPFLCTPENIDLLMEEWTEFRVAVMGTPLSWALMTALEQEQKIKN